MRHMATLLSPRFLRRGLEFFAVASVVALIALKVETSEADTVASEVSKFTEVEDVFLVTGDTDIFLKVRFPHYEELKEFALHRLPGVRGIRETKTLLVVTAYKEGGETHPA